MKPTNPYTKLKAEASEWVRKALHPRRIGMYCYPAKSIGNDTWTLFGLSERVRAADQLGFDVRLYWDDSGLNVQYVQKMPSAPWWAA